jgi:hypothetical protein
MSDRPNTDAAIAKLLAAAPRNAAYEMGNGLANFEAIVELEHVLREWPSDAVDDVKLTHHFAPGIYLREVVMPAGIMVVGKIHMTEHVCIVSKGRVLSWTAGGMTEIVGPVTFVTREGTKRALYVLEETIWATVHPTTSRDLAQIEDVFIARSREEFLALTQGEAK